MLSEDQKTRLRVLSIGAALVWVVLGLISGWPAWVWIALAVISVFAPTIAAYVQAERVLRRSGRGARSSRRSRPTDDADDSGGSDDSGGGTLNARESAPGAGLATRRDTTAADHALALVGSLPLPQRHRFARDLASLLDDNELRTAARAVRQERAEAVSHEDTRPARSGATSTSRVRSSGRSNGSRRTEAPSSGPGTGSSADSGGLSIADSADRDDVVITGAFASESRSALENFLDARPRIHMPEPPAERVPARGSHDEDDAAEDDDGDGG